jgi:hypothetical protein
VPRDFETFSSAIFFELIIVSNYNPNIAMSDELDADILFINKLTESSNNILIRLVGVTDVLLLEQLRDDYQNSVSYIAAKEAEYYKKLLVTIKERFIKNYKGHFLPIDNIISHLDKTYNTQLTDDIKKYRLREPKDIHDRRNLLLIANTLNVTFVVKDLEGYILDTIGKHKMQYEITVDLMKRFSSDDYSLANAVCLRE